MRADVNTSGLTLIKRMGVLLISLSLCACAYGMRQRESASSSLVDFLYPKGEVPREVTRQVPKLKLPLTVGLGFVPSGVATGQSVQSPYFQAGTGLSEALKNQMLEKMKAAFGGREYLRDIVVIPEVYLRRNQKDGFDTVEQLSRLYGFDVIALVSYDQISTSTQSDLSLLYLTLAGAYLIKADEHDVSTFIDTAIFDVRTRQLLFRAPGINQAADKSSLVEAPQAVRKIREQSFELAVQDMVKNLEKELAVFTERIKKDKVVEISSESKHGSGGAGSFSFFAALMLLIALMLRGLRFT